MQDAPETTLNSSSRKSWIRTVICAAEVSIILAILGVWIGAETVRESKSLVILFFYSFPSEFLVGLVPHEPILLYYGKYFPPLIVALVSVAGTVLAEMFNYSVFSYFTDTEHYRRFRGKKSVDAIVRLFSKAPFAAILVAGFTPVPFFPIRFLVVMGNYPVLKYALGVFLSRAPRFYILAGVGSIFNIPGTALVALFAGLMLFAWAPVIRRALGRPKRKAASGEEGGL